MNPPGFAVVIDTNVWISGLLTKTGGPALLTRQVIRDRQRSSPRKRLRNSRDRLWRPKFDRYVTLEQRKSLLGDIESSALWINVPPSIAARKFCRDAADDKFIHAALAAESAWLVTGDNDLLALSDTVLPLGVRIVSPADALRLPEFSPTR